MNYVKKKLYLKNGDEAILVGTSIGEVYLIES